MSWLLFVSVIALLITTFISVLLSILAWRRRTIPGIRPFAVLMLAVSEWTFASVLVHLSPELPAKIFWTNMEYLGIVLVPPAWFMFAIQCAGQERRMAKHTPILLAIHPVVTLVLVWTDPLHHWFRKSVWLNVDNAFPLLGTITGPAFWVHTTYSYVLLFWGTALLIWTYLNASRLYKRQMTLLLIGAVAPWITNFLFIFGLNPFPYLDLTPFAFTLTGIMMAWGILRFKLLDIVPIARDAVVEGLRDAIIVLDVQNRIVDVNKAAQRMLGFSSHQVIGQPAQDVFSNYADLQEQYGNSDDIHVEFELDVQAAKHVYELHVSPLLDRHNQTKGKLISVSDITGRKRTEWAMQQSEIALRKYTAELEAQNDELDAFAHTVAHDLKGPLGMLMGYSSLLEQGQDELSEKVFQQSTRAIAQNARKMNNIINELLLLASVRKMDEVDIAPLAMGVIVDEVLERLSDAIEKSQAEINVPETWPVVVGYAPWIEEVWANYINNAIKYGGQPPHITLGATQTTHEDNLVRFWVRDTGSGLSPSQQTNLFAPFERLQQVRAKGHGLGLSIARRIIEKLEGNVGVESTGIPGEGSTFYFSLPKA